VPATTPSETVITATDRMRPIVADRPAGGATPEGRSALALAEEAEEPAPGEDAWTPGSTGSRGRSGRNP
jgi:hypothetical protein